MALATIRMFSNFIAIKSLSEREKNTKTIHIPYVSDYSFFSAHVVLHSIKWITKTHFHIHIILVILFFILVTPLICSHFIHFNTHL